MGIYGALSTAVTGLRAQSFALENISGNIANSQTTGFKRIDTDFVDMIPDAALRRQTAGSVLAQSRSTNNVQGDIKGASTDTYMAINGNGFFVVEPRIGQVDGNSVFSGASYYTRRGDFEMDKNGYLVNGAGYYLKGLPIDAATQNVSGSVPQVLQITNSFLPAKQTTRVDYQLNLPEVPKTVNYQKSGGVAGSELLSAGNFVTLTPDVPAAATGATVASGDASSVIASNGNTLTIQIGSVSRAYSFTNSGGTGLPVIDVTDAASDTVGEMLQLIEADLQGLGATNASVQLVGGRIVVSSGDLAQDVTIVDDTTGSSNTGFAFANGTSTATVNPATALGTRVPTITAAQSADFIAQSISGGGVTVYAANGAPADVMLRWAKVNSVENGGADVWNLYAMTDSTATGTGTMWTQIGGDYRFGSNGSPNPPVESTSLSNLTVNGITIGNVKLQHGLTGMTQFSDPGGTAEVTTLTQNGYAAGEFVSVAVNDNGRVVVSYNNNQQVEVAQVVTANFNAENQLKRMDGGVFAATSESGAAILEHGAGIVGASLEASNTDISEEFTKLIVTQQAYAAGTRIVSTADQMLKEALNMVR